MAYIHTLYICHTSNTNYMLSKSPITIRQGVNHLHAPARDQGDPTNDILPIGFLTLLAPVTFHQGLQVTTQGIGLLDPVDEHILPNRLLFATVHTHHFELSREVRTNILQGLVLIHINLTFLFFVHK